ncbi:excalibur calcium-binding domain-containing protein [Nocardia ignorata]|uniref:excalibur calcium-binding domain-containing protein n=1 Tax=Nocardia ignorata TaxID=145285 RepID=UPI001FB80241|nr:excalibur calcium-binding domain-containing protein [Nocardia ignorata]
MPPPTVDLPRPEAPSPGVYYKNCKAARAAGAGEPGYRPELDENSDGVACE